MIGARKDFDQRRLPRPILTDEGVDLASGDREVHVLERVHPGEGLVYPGHDHDVLSGVSHCVT